MNQELSSDLHIHSTYSLDSILFPQLIVRLAKFKGLGAIAITDHDTIKGGLQTRMISDNELLVIVGCEVKTDFGDLIGLFLNEDIRSRRFEDVLDEIEDQGGLAVLPHPYRRKLFPPDNLLKRLDLIEGLNGRTSLELNQRGLMLAKSLGKPVIAGSDAHNPFEVGIAKVIMEDSRNADEELFRKKLVNGYASASYADLPPALRNASIFFGYAMKKIRNIRNI